VYTGIVVETCTASAVSATLIRRNINGPRAEDGPKGDSETETKVDAVGRLDDRPEVLGTVRVLPLAVAAAGFFAVIVLDGRRCILLSRILFWATGAK
jgi:hypothetical protein